MVLTNLYHHNHQHFITFLKNMLTKL